MKYSEVKNISKVVDAKLKKASIKEKKRLEEEKKELDDIPPEEQQEETHFEEHEDHTENTEKKYIYVAVALLAVGGWLHFKSKEA